MSLRSYLTMLLLVPAVAAAQDSSLWGVPADPRLVRVLTSQVGKPVRLYSPFKGWLAGRLLERSERHVVLGAGAAASVRRMPLAEIDSVWVRGRATRKGMVVGAVVGGVGLAAVAAGLASIFEGVGFGDTDYDTGMVVRVGVGGLLVGAAGGAVIGAGIGALIPRWRRGYP